MFNILVVEDDTNSRRLMCTVLEQYGYNAVPAIDGIDALDVLDKKHIDLIILDIMMPRMDGFEFTDTLRKAGCTHPSQYSFLFNIRLVSFVRSPSPRLCNSA